MQSNDVLALHEGLPRHEVERLLSAASGRSRSDLMVGVEIAGDDVEVFRGFVSRRLRHEPLQYIEGSVPFGTVEIQVDDRVLVPRPETEYLLELVSGLADHPEVIVDLCTGSGNLALALKAEFPSADVHATELSPDSLDVARRNAERNGIAATFHEGDLFDPLPPALKGRVDVLVANPPYLSEGEMADLPPDVRNEPVMALLSGPEGDEIVRRIADGFSEWMAPEGIVAIEVSEFHATTVVPYFSGIGASVINDLSGRDRYVLGRTPVE